MFGEGLLFDEEFWRALEAVDVLKEEQALSLFLEEAQLSENLFKKVQTFLKDFDYELKVYEREGQSYLAPANTKFSLMEWISLQDKEAQNKDLKIFRAFETQRREGAYYEQLSPAMKKKADVIEEALLNKHSLVISLKDGKTQEIFPYQLSYVEGQLSLVGEDCQERCLVAHDVKDCLRLVSVSRKGYKPCFSKMEINDFMAALREMSGKEMRLIIKFSSAEKFDLSPRHHFLGNPYITSNSEGELIWAASVEQSSELMEWLYSIRWAIVEIMDPGAFHQEFLSYCKEREKKVA